MHSGANRLAIRAADTAAANPVLITRCAGLAAAKPPREVKEEEALAPATFLMCQAKFIGGQAAIA
jgi:hypothetical protein